MKKSSFFIILMTLVLALCVFGSPQSIAGQKIHQMQGQITAVEPYHNTAVVEVPMGGKLYTVAGPLSYEPILRKGGRSVELKDFAAGDQVTVRWKITENGHIIFMLEAK